MLNDPVILSLSSAIGSAIGGTIVGLILKRSLKKYDDIHAELKSLKSHRIAKIEERLDNPECSKCPTKPIVAEHEFYIKSLQGAMAKNELNYKSFGKMEVILDRLERTMMSFDLKLDAVSEAAAAQAVELKNNSKYIGNVSRKITEHVNHGVHHNG